MKYYAQCTQCKKMVTITDDAAWHSDTGCLSCDPVRNAYGFFSEPEDFWQGRRVIV